MNEDNLYEIFESYYGLTKPQIIFSNYLLKKLNEDYNSYQYIKEHEIQKSIQEHFHCELTKNDISYTLDKLEHDLFLIEKHFEDRRYKISHHGKEILQKYNELIIYLGKEVKDNYEMAVKKSHEEEIKNQIDNLTLKQLKGTIFHVNKWWLIVIINAIITIIVSVVIALIINKIGIN